MLRELSVQNLALIEDVHVELDGGYCAWTGETGAGKSLLLTALGLVLGGKASAELIRSGKTEARAAAVFEVPEPGLRAEVEAILGGGDVLEDDALIVTRRISAQGRGGATVNGLPVTLATLQKLGERLVDIHGQHEGRALMDPDRQRELLDDYGGLGDRVDAYRAARATHEALRRKRQELIDSAEARRRERALLEFERDELAAADPEAGRARRADPRGAAALARRPAPHGRGRGLCLALRGRPLGAGAVEARGADARAAGPGRPRAGRGVGHARAPGRRGPRGGLRPPRPRPGLGRRPGPAGRRRGAAGPVPPAGRAVPLHARRAGGPPRRDRGPARRPGEGRGRPAGPGRAPGRRLVRAEAGRRRAHDRPPQGRQGLRPGDPGTAQAPGPRRRPADGRGRAPRAGRRSDRRRRPPNRAPTASRCSSRPTPARRPARCARSPPAASSRG